MRGFRVTVLAAGLAALPGVASAQFPPPFPSAQAPVQDRWPDPPKPPQAAPAPPPAAAQPAPAAPRRAPAQAKTDDDASPEPAKKPAAAAAPSFAVACNGVFSKDSTHLKLAMKYDSRNLTFGTVDGPEGSKIPGTILFPNDPKRRLEVLWANDVARAGTSVIAINGKSQWAAPKGLKIGMPLAAVEKLNGRPFKVSGFEADGSTGVIGWEGGALSSLPGGCKVGLRLIADAKVPKEARDAVAGEKEYLSNDAGVKAMKPAIAEILIGY